MRHRAGKQQIVHGPSKSHDTFRERAQELHLLLDTLQRGILTTDTDGITTYVNQRFCSMLGYHPDEMLGISVFEMVDDSHVDTARAHYQRGLNSHVDDFEVILTRKDGTRIPAEFAFSAILDRSATVTGVIAVVTDMSARKNADDAYRLLVDSSVQGLAILQQGRVVFCNNALATISGYSCDELRGMSSAMVEAAVHVDDRARVLSAMKRRLAGKEIEADLEFRFIHKGGIPRWVETTSIRTEFNGSPALLITYREATQRHQAEAALHESEERFKASIKHAPVAVAVYRGGGGAVYGNPAYQRMFGIQHRNDIAGRFLIDHVAPQCREDVTELFMRRTSGEPVNDEIETTALRLDGTQFPCRIALTMLVLSDGPATLAFFFDLTAQKQSEKALEDSQGKLRNLAVYLLHAREEERKKVAREIHDELGQTLTALKMDLQWIERRLAPRPEHVMEKIRDVVGLADQAIQMVHRIASELRPGVLDDLGLAAAIEWLGKDFSRRNGIPCSVDVTTPESLIGGNSATALFRIVQEALTNVAHHAQASRASIEIWEADRCLTVRVRDDGKGVTEEQSTSPIAFGLIGIRERAQGLRGEMSILGRPGMGTTLTVTIPLPPEGSLA
jgi:PAS domain S-box-containing protein